MSKIKDILSFNLSDINNDLLNKEIEKESLHLFNCPSSRRGRTLKKIRNSVVDGKPAERFLIEKFSCIDNIELYGDVISKDGVKIECKASHFYWSDRRIRDTILEIKKYNSSDWIMFWQIDNERYIFHKKIKLK